MWMTAKRFTGEFDKQYSGVYDDREQLTNFEVVNLLNELHEELEPIKKICKKYRIPLKDLPEILEEYIAYDNDDEW